MVPVLILVLALVLVLVASRNGRGFMGRKVDGPSGILDVPPGVSTGGTDC